MKKRIVATVISLAMVAASLTGCGKAAGDSAASNTSSGGDDVETIIWWLGGDEPEDFQEALDIMNAYTAEKIGVKVDIKLASWGDYTDKVNMVVNSGEYFDMMWTEVGTYQQFVELGAFQDITDKVKTVSPDLYKFIPEKLWNGVLIDDKIYSVPTYKDSSCTFYVCWDKALVDQYGIDYENVDTIDEVSDWLYKIHDETGENVWTCSKSTRGAQNWIYPLYSKIVSGIGYVIGVGTFDESGKVVPILEQEDAMKILKTYHQWYLDGIINQDAPTLESMPSKSNILCSQGYPGAESVWAHTLGCDETVITPINEAFYDTSTIQGSLNAISSGSEHVDACLKYLQLLNTDNYLRNMLAYGVEGKDWEYTDTESKTGTVKKLSDTWGLAAFAQATFFNLSPVDPDPADKYDQILAMNESAKEAVTCGFALEKTNIETELANVSAIYDKYYIELFCGVSDPEVVVPQMYEEMYDAGLQKIIDEAQKQMDEFLAQKK